jgi:hypothetical protein
MANACPRFFTASVIASTRDDPDARKRVYPVGACLYLRGNAELWIVAILDHFALSVISTIRFRARHIVEDLSSKTYLTTES